MLLYQQKRIIGGIKWYLVLSRTIKEAKITQERTIKRNKDEETIFFHLEQFLVTRAEILASNNSLSVSNRFQQEYKAATINPLWGNLEKCKLKWRWEKEREKVIKKKETKSKEKT